MPPKGKSDEKVQAAAGQAAGEASAAPADAALENGAGGLDGLAGADPQGLSGGAGENAGDGGTMVEAGGSLADADAGSQMQGMRIHHKRLGEQVGDLQGHDAAIDIFVRARKNKRKVVTADACHRV